MTLIWDHQRPKYGLFLSKLQVKRVLALRRVPFDGQSSSSLSGAADKAKATVTPPDPSLPQNRRRPEAARGKTHRDHTPIDAVDSL